ncbi:MAG: DnaJ domain-containing protein [Firmicutes bacterium]|nr:DnaJ domain-containing protein [Bacillota bacterium]
MDPYKVLGVSRDADEETIKKAYKALVKKYHPDKYVNSPMADVASEKMKEINRAYDMITKGETADSRGAGGTGNTGGAGYGSYGGNPFGGGYGAGAQATFQNVRILIQLNRLNDAQQMLNSLPKTAEWYYLCGIIYQRRGWYDKAVENIQTAINMDPNNAEYRSAMDSMKNKNASFTGSPYRRTTGISCSTCCTVCLCLRCLGCC